MFFSALQSCKPYDVLKGYNPLVVVRPLLFQILNEAGDFPVELHHHPELEKTQKEIVVDFTSCRGDMVQNSTGLGDLVFMLLT